MSRGGTVGPQLEARLRQILAAAVGPAASAAMEAATTGIAGAARVAWYSQVQRKTGKSGVWSSELRVTSAGIQAAIVSGDDRRSKGKFATYFIRRPGPVAMLRRPVTQAEYNEAIRVWRSTGNLPPQVEAGRPAAGGSPPTNLRHVTPHPLRGDGRVVLLELVLKPGRKAARALAAQLAVAVSRGAR